MRGRQSANSEKDSTERVRDRTAQKEKEATEEKQESGGRCMSVAFYRERLQRASYTQVKTKQASEKEPKMRTDSQSQFEAEMSSSGRSQVSLED